ncbi:SIMPL domain-containing protein, partial [Acinetobacter baumannii]
SVVNILKAYSKDDTNIKTGSVSANKHYQWNGKQNVFDGFNATVSINFVLSDISKFTALTGKLLETRINSIKQVQFTHSKADSLL